MQKARQVRSRGLRPDFGMTIIVAADVGLEMRRDVEELFETFNAPGEKVLH